MIRPAADRGALFLRCRRRALTAANTGRETCLSLDDFVTAVPLDGSMDFMDMSTLTGSRKADVPQISKMRYAREALTDAHFPAVP